MEDTDSEDEPMFPFDAEFNYSPAFDYNDPLLTSPLLKAILDSDLESTKVLIQNGKHISSLNNIGNSPLHAGVIQKSLEILDLLLQIPDVDLNYKNHMGDTPLLLALNMHHSDSFIIRLLEAGCDINARNSANEMPLHTAIAYSSTFIVHELIKRGADINATDGNKYSPLHHAVDRNNLDMVCLLLYYNADVEIKCLHNLTPFMYAVNDRDKLDIARMLFDYNVDFSYSSFDGWNALLLAANCVNPIAVNIVNAGADVNLITPEGHSVLFFALDYHSAELFKAVWPKFDHQNLLYSEIPFLFKFLELESYSTSEWLECMYKILNSSFIFDLITHHLNYVKLFHRMSFLKTLIHALYKKNVNLSDRLTIIQTCLSFGAEALLMDINVVHELYGFNEEIEILIHFGRHYESLNNVCYFPLPTFIFTLEKTYSSEFIAKLFEHQFEHYVLTAPEKKATINNIVYALRFFSMSYNSKQKIRSFKFFRADLRDAVLKEIDSVPEFPSLVELSRNKVRQCIKETNIIKRPYYFHNVVNNLDVPTLIKNIILFKQPLYK